MRSTAWFVAVGILLASCAFAVERAPVLGDRPVLVLSPAAEARDEGRSVVAQWVSDPNHFVIPGDLTTVPKRQPTTRTAAAIFERVVVAGRTMSLADFLLDLDEPASQAIAAMLTRTLASSELPEGAAVRVLVGPWRGTNMLVPYRVSIYLPEPRSGELKHVVTVARSDGGTYVIGVMPPAVADLPGPATERAPPPLGAETTSELKVDRFRPGT